MLRLIVFLLIAANGLYFTWSAGYLSALGWSPSSAREPERMHLQIKPDALRLLSASEAKRLQSLPQKPTECLQSEVLTQAQVQALRTHLLADAALWPQASWSLESFTETGTWAIFMGPYPNEAMLDKKKQELKRLGIRFEPLHTQALGSGLSLATSPSKAGLDQQLAALNQQGVRTAKIVSWRLPATGTVLKLPQVSDDTRPLLGAVSAFLPSPDGAALRKCPT
jgi:hypothetical protein